MYRAIDDILKYSKDLVGEDLTKDKIHLMLEAHGFLEPPAKFKSVKLPRVVWLADGDFYMVNVLSKTIKEILSTHGSLIFIGTYDEVKALNFDDYEYVAYPDEDFGINIIVKGLVT